MAQRLPAPYVATAVAVDGRGGRGVWVEDREALVQELDAALQAETCTIPACRIGRAAHDGRP